MGKLSKLAQKAEELASQSLAKVQELQAQQQQQQQQQAANGTSGSPYAPPAVHQQIAPAHLNGVTTQRPAAVAPYQPGLTGQANVAAVVAQQQQVPSAGSTHGTPPEYLPPTTLSPQGPQKGRKKALLIGCCYPGIDHFGDLAICFSCKAVLCKPLQLLEGWAAMRFLQYI
jgi:hypothetical protein